MSNTSMNTEYANHRLSDGSLQNLREFLNDTPGIGNDLSNGRVTSTGSTTTRTLADRFADVVNVKDFGAIGDGITDDTNSIQLALDSASCIYFPEGYYKVTATLNIQPNQHIIGESRRSTFIGTEDTDLLLFNVNNANNCIIEHLGFTHEADLKMYTDATFAGQAIAARSGNSTHGVIIRNCYFRDIARQAIVDWAQDSSNWLIEGNHGERLGRELVFLAGARYARVTNNFAFQTGDDGIALNDNCINCVISNNVIISAATSYHVDDGALESSAGAGICTHGNNITITGNTILNPRNAGISLRAGADESGPENCIIANNVITGLENRGSWGAGIEISGAVGPNRFIGNTINLTNAPTRPAVQLQTITGNTNKTNGILTFDSNTFISSEANICFNQRTLNIERVNISNCIINGYRDIFYNGQGDTEYVYIKNCLTETASIRNIVRIQSGIVNNITISDNILEFDPSSVSTNCYVEASNQAIQNVFIRKVVPGADIRSGGNVINKVLQDFTGNYPPSP